MLSTVEKVVGTALGLVALFLLLNNPKGVNELFGSIGKFSTASLGTLQGRTINAYGVQVGK